MRTEDYEKFASKMDKPDFGQEDIYSDAPPPTEEPIEKHPLAQFIKLDYIVKPPRWVIPYFIEEGVTVIAGSLGVGKTTALLPLALMAAGLHGDDLLPIHWRHVIYISEDSRQAQRIITGMVNYGDLNISTKDVDERLHLVDAVRLDASYISRVGKFYLQKFKRVVNGVDILPLVILDTKSAIIQMDNENDNAEAAKIMCVLKQDFSKLPIWIIGHVTKDKFGRTDVNSSRGAGAIDADANQTLFLIKEDEQRYLIQGKERCCPKWRDLEIGSQSVTVAEQDVFGNFENVTVRWGIAKPPSMSRKEASKQATEAAQKADEGELRQSIRDAVDTAWMAGNPLNRTGLRAMIKRNHETVNDTIENLLTEQWMYEVHVPAKERIHPKKSLYLVNFSTVEHEAILAGNGLPDVKLIVPESWRKTPISSVPAKNDECSKDDSVSEG